MHLRNLSFATLCLLGLQFQKIFYLSDICPNLQIKDLGSSYWAQKQKREARTRRDRDSMKLSKKSLSSGSTIDKTRYPEANKNWRSPWNSSLEVILVSKSSRHLDPGSYFREYLLQNVEPTTVKGQEKILGFAQSHYSIKVNQNVITLFHI